MREEDFSQRSNALPDDDATNVTVTQSLDGIRYAKKMKARYEWFVQSKAISETEGDTSIVPTTPRIPVTPGVPSVPTTPSVVHLRGRPFLKFQTQRILAHMQVIVLVVVVGLVTFFVQSYRLSIVPDVFSDEGAYLQIGINLAKGNGLTINHQPFLYHPPAYLLIEAAYIKLMGLTNADALITLLSVRYLNIVFSAITASLLLLFGRKLHSYKAGLIMVALFLMDPYVQRINRRNMLETFAMLCLLLGFYTFFTSKDHLTKRQWIGSGIAFGIATLTKEPMFVPLIALLGIVAWTRRTQLADVVRVITIACCIYLSYPLGEIVFGNGQSYLTYKLSQIGGVVSSITGHGLGASSQKTVSVGNAETLLGQYASSYLLLALAGVFTILLLLYFRRHVEARYLSVWSIVNFGYFLILGRLSDQYFYYLIVPSIIVNGYVLTRLFEIAQYRRWAGQWSGRWLGIVLSLFLCLLFMYNSIMWMTKYVYSSDNGYTKIITYIETNLPPGTTIDASDDVTNYLLTPTYTIRFDRNIQGIIARHEHYFIMSSKDRWGGYNDTTPAFYDWVIHNSQPLVVTQEASFWTIGLYYMKTSNGSSSPPPSVTMGQSYLGTVYDISTGMKTNMSLTDVRQQQWNVTGYFSGMVENKDVRSIVKNRPFTGTISAAKQIQFILIGSIDQFTFSFQGIIKPDSSIVGTYCGTKTSAQKCSDYGLWSVSPANHFHDSPYPTQSATRSIIVPSANPNPISIRKELSLHE